MVTAYIYLGNCLCEPRCRLRIFLKPVQIQTTIDKIDPGTQGHIMYEAGLLVYWALQLDF